MNTENDNETVREVCAEIGDWDAEVCKDHPIARPNEVLGQTMAKIRWWRDRILSAHDREMAAKDAEIKNLRDINSKLRDNLLEEMASIAAKDDEIEKIKLDFITLSNTFNRTVVNPQFRILELEKKVALLERALKPVMECAVCKVDGMAVADGEICTSSDYGVCDYEGNQLDWHDVAECLDAVRDAQRVMREGGKE